MSINRLDRLPRYLLLLFAISFVLILPAAARAESSPAEQLIRQSWERADAIGRFRFETNTIQTTHPTAHPANIGRRATTDTFDVQGDIDQPTSGVVMQIWPHGRQRDQSLSFKVEDGHTFGRTGEDDDWVAVDDATDLFVSNAQPLSFLSAAENVNVLGSDNESLFPGELLPEALDQAITRYSFDLNGLAYARFMRATMEAELRRTGELPPGVSLGLVQEYVDMTGEGELWLDANGLPYRQIIHVSFPPGDTDLDWIEAQITTDYSNWDAQAFDLSGLDWTHPATAVASLLLLKGWHLRDGLPLLIGVGYGLLLLGFCTLLFSRRHGKRARVALSLLIITSILIVPLLQAKQVSAFTDRQKSRSAAAARPQAAAATANSTTFRPTMNPLAVTQSDSALEQPAADESSMSQARLAQDTVCTVGESSDCDSDGLSDKVEIFELGTFADEVDSDGDGISDNLEVVGFSVGGQTWYMNPRDPDSNGDGQPDGLECSARYNIKADGSIDSTVAAGTCQDTDGDGVPDVWDYDNDKDGVPDTVDSDPYSYRTVTDKEFGLTLAGYETDKPLMVDIDIRPTNDQHLWWTNNYLDWPDLDQAGQIMRVTTDTLGTDGDMMLSPILEITIPFNSANPSRSLPVKSGVSVSGITATSPIDNWLDTDVLDQYGMVVNQDADDGTLVVYAPLALTRDVVGESPVAWNAHIYYEMAGAATGWGQSHQMRLLWTVNAVVDECNMPEGETWSSYCDVGSDRENTTNLSHWTTSQSVIQTYYDDFIVTSLAVREEHTVDAAVIAQKAGASGASAHYDNYMWHLAETLEETFLGAQLVSGQRFSVADIGTHYANWGIPAAALYFNHLTGLSSSTELQAQLSGDNVITLLDTVYSGASKPDTANLLMVGDRTYRSVGLDDATLTAQDRQADGTIALDLSGSETITTGFMRFSPYSYNGSTWANLDLATYLDTLGSDLAPVFTQAQIESLAGSSAGYDLAEAQDGAINLAKNFYASVYSGAITLLQDGATVISTGTLEDSAHGLPSEPAVSVVSDLLGNIQDFYVRISLSNLSLTASLYAELESIATTSWVALANSNGQILEALGQMVQGDTTTSNTIALQQLQYAPQIAGNLTSMLDAGALDYTYKSTIGTAETYGSGAEQLALVYYGTYRGVYKIYSAYRYFTGAQANVSRLLSGIIEDYETQLYLGYALKVGVAISSFVYAWATGKITPGSPEFAQKVAFELATIIVATIVLIVLTVATGGIVLGVLAVLAVVDAVTAAICAAVGVKPGSEVDQWVCGGLTGALEKAITYIINDYTPLVDLTRSGRLDSAMSTPTITQETDTPGFAVGNSINVTATVTSTLYFGHPNWMGYAYADTQLTDDNLGASTFAYQLQTTPADINLDLNGTTWNAIGGTGTFDGIPSGARFQQEFEAPVAYTLDASEAGVNTGLGIYLAEGFAMNAQDCWLVLTDPICGLEHYRDTNQTDLSSDLIFDVFPETIDGFHALALVGNDSYQLAWDTSFPTLADGDGDGLRSKAVGGNDPDDSTPDTDGDGLSDYFESTYLMDPTTADGDSDGLTDYWEAYYLTDPYDADSDDDGLLDSEEAFHPNWIYPYENSALSNKQPPSNAPSQSSYAGGWEIVYDYDGATPLKSWVSADPNDFDSDDDTIDDYREEIYGYNPRAASTLKVLGLLSTVQASNGSTFYPYPYAKPTSSLGYTAKITNDLSDRWALGLLQTELPTDIVRATKELGVLQPLAVTTLTGSTSAGNSGLSGSGTTNLTMRAGAIIVGDDDRVLWLRMNEAAGAKDFTDSSVYDHDAFCNACPTANGSYLSFSPTSNSAQQVLVVPTEAMAAQSFTLGLWVNVTTQGTISLYNFETVAGGKGEPNFALNLSNSAINMVVQNSAYTTNQTISIGDWNHLLVSYDGTSHQTTLYVNGIQKWQQNTVAINYGQLNFDVVVGSGNSDTKFAMDEVELFNRVLDATEIEQLYGQPVLDVSFYPQLDDVSPSNNTLTCAASSTCPTSTSEGGTFAQEQFVSASGSALNFSGDAFTFSAWVKPETRTNPFDTSAVSAYNNLTGAAPRDTDSSHDWQGVYGAVDSSNRLKVAPTLFVNPAGQMRAFMGNGTSTCYYDTAAGLIDYDTWQHITVSYDGSIFTFYIDGNEVAQSTNVCAQITPSNLGKLEVGRASAAGVIYFNKAYFEDGEDGGGKYEIRINLDGDDSGHNIFSRDNVTADSKHTETLNFAYYLTDGNHTFRWWEDDSSPNNNDYHGCKTGCDDNWVDTTVSDTGLGQVTATWDNNDLGIADSSSGTLYWSVSNDFFQGQIDEFKAYSRALSAEDVLNLYEASYDGLYFNFDEPPGANVFVDAYDSNVQAACDYPGGTCPDSGIAGIENQSAYFQGGVDYLQLPQIDLLKSLNSSFAVAAWVNPDSPNGFQRVIAADRDNSVNGWSFGLTGNKLILTTYGVKDYVSSATVKSGTWQHIAVVLDSNYDASFYLNGSYVDTISGSAPANSNTDDPYRIGSATNSNGDGTTTAAFYGRIDDLVVVTRELDASGVQRLMQNAPLLNLHLDEDLFTTAFVNEVGVSSDANCGSATACPGAGDKGQIRESVVFDGVDDILSVPIYSYTGAFGGLPEFTVGLWVNPTQIKNDYQPLIAMENSTGGDRNFGLFIHPDSMDINMSVSNSACSAYVGKTAFNNPLLLHQWNHVMFTFDGSIEKLYINGTLRATNNYSGTPCLSSNLVKIGNEVSHYTPFAGGIDEVTIRGRALSSYEIANIFAYQSSWFDIKESHPIVIDNDNPTVSLDRENSFVAPGETVFKIAAQDPTSEIVSVKYGISGYTGAVNATNTNGVWTFVYDFEDEGTYNIVLEAIDSVGNSTVAIETLYVDALPPTGIAESSPPPKPTDGTIFWSNIYLEDKASTDGGNSGVDPNSVMVSLRDPDGEIVSGPVQAISYTNEVYGAVLPITSDVYGNYTFSVSFTDMVGNRGGFDRVAMLDSLGPHADVLLHASTTITPGLTLSGIASDVEHIWQSRSMQLHFEESSGATTELDTSGNEFEATCDLRTDPDDTPLPSDMLAQCPTAGATGKYASAASFDGSNDRYVITDSVGPSATTGITVPIEQRLGLYDGSFTVMAWVNGTKWVQAQALLGVAASDPDNDMSIGFLDGKPAIGYAGGSLVADTQLPVGQWAHVAYSYNDDNQTLSIYINGVLSKSLSGHQPFTGTNTTVTVGELRDTEFFSGLIDELVIYPLALADDRLDDIANPVDSGMSKIEVRFRHIDEDGVAEENGTWYEGAFTTGTEYDVFRNWQFTVPGGLSGSYKIDLRATDSYGVSQSNDAVAADRASDPPHNRRFVPGVWAGIVIDQDVEPVFTTTFMPVIGGRP